MACYRLPVPQAVLGLGSNLGARRALLRCAITLLAGQPGLSVLARSDLYETPPLGPPQPDYLNAAVRVSWCGTLAGLFAVTQQVEQWLGRERRERWGARTIDIDILHWSEGPVHTPWLHVPHRELAARPFALAPLLDVLPELEPTYGPPLTALGGAPARSNPGWLELVATAGDTREHRVHAVPDEELACLAVSAVGACARTPCTARSSLFFASARPPLEDDTSFLLARVETLRAQGFRTCDAAITAVDGTGTRGYLIGEHTGTRETDASPRVILGPAQGPTRTISVLLAGVSAGRNPFAPRDP